MISRFCPMCDTDVDFEEWCEDFACPHCDVTLAHRYECDEDGYFYDYLEQA